MFLYGQYNVLVLHTGIGFPMYFASGTVSYNAEKLLQSSVLLQMFVALACCFSPTIEAQAKPLS